MSTLSIDFGYGWAKSILTTTKPTYTQFPHALGTPDPVRFRPDALGARAGYPISVRRDGETHSFFVGELAINQSRHAWSLIARQRNTWELRALLAESIDRATNGQSVDIDVCVSGLPVSWYAEDKAEHSEALLGTTEYSKGDAWHAIDIKKVYVIPQPLGTLLYLAYGEQDTSILTAIKDKYLTGVIDIGHFTTDCITVKGADYLTPIHRSFSIPIGISRLQGDLAQIVQQAYRRELDPREADEILRRGSIRVRGKEEKLPIDNAITSLCTEIMSEVQSHWGEALDLDQVVVTGGGAHVLFNGIKTIYPHARSVTNPEEANVRGYEVYAKALEGKR